MTVTYANPAGAGTGTLSVQTQSWQPNPASVGDNIYGNVSATLNPTSLDPGDGTGNTYVTYNWTTGGVWESPDGVSGDFTPYGGDNIISWEEGSANTQFDAVFYDAGFYILQVNCTATIHSTADGSTIGTLNATGYIGGDTTDFAGSSGSGGGSSADATSGGGGNGLPVRPDILFTGKEIIDGQAVPVQNVDIMHNVIFVQRGAQCTFSLSHTSGASSASSNIQWTMQSGGQPAAAWSWISEYGVDDIVNVTPLQLTVWGNLSPRSELACVFTSLGYSVSVQCQMPSGVRNATINVVDLKPTARDTVYYISYKIRGSSKRTLLTLNVPPGQIGYPLTPSPSYTANANAAYSAGKAGNPWFLFDQNNHGGIGAWGDSDCYPDELCTPYTETAPYNHVDRRLGANFNYGVMMRAYGLSYSEALSLADGKVLFKHNPVQQAADACGWIWEAAGAPPLSTNKSAPTQLTLPPDFTL